MTEQPTNGEPIFLSPQQRYEHAVAAFNQVNQALPAGMQPFQVPPWMEPTAGLDALVRLLIEKGLVGEEEFILAKIGRMAELMEQLTGVAREAKRQAMGLVVAGPGRPV